MLIDIGEVARRSGLTAATLRYYEAQGLISSCARHGLRRQYQPQVLQQLAMIALGRTAGFSLAEIRQMFGDDGTLEVDRQALASKADELDRSIRRLTTLREGLRHAAQCPAPRHMDCPKFQRILLAASRPAPKRA
ncbi:helix-turn-helix domain-containing protein [Comamonas odontotermitis]|uniref:helix-turn-helix domain-containing protein n=1 Tax=Comamonas odontotermitis TaxID=379895 RepID=UPI001CC5B0E5|nr:helix-turn-helix domain-containing protein [Comamonas odontotermitis]UBB16719.1 helix-turn-helix domain-containing protein [Comamonas odontotermitis]